MLKKFVMPLVGALAGAVLVVPAPTSAHISSAPGDVRIAPGRFDTVRIGDSLESAAESGYFALDVKTPGCGTRDIWPTRPWRKSIDIYQGYEEETAGTVGTIGVFGDGISTREGIAVGSTLGDLEAAYGDRLLGPRENDYGQWGYFIRTNRRWLGFSMDASSADGRPTTDAEVAFIEITKGRRPGLLRDGC
jgi:hypothetical protein